MKSKYPIFFLLILIYTSTSGQGSWTPTVTPPVIDRYDDVYFLNEDTGWAVTLANGGQIGRILKTVNGGNTWDSTNAPISSAYRDIGFLDAQTGFAGTLWRSTSVPTDIAMMHMSTDGGMNWSPVTNLPGPFYAGICGMCVINDSTLYACGRFYGPPLFYKTTNKGASWSYVRLDSLAGGLVDAHFFGPDTGFIVGTTDTTGAIIGTPARGVILYTVDGGNHWERIRVSDHDTEMCWKISFPSRITGYVSLESFRAVADSQFCLKTTDGGLTWHSVYFTTASRYLDPSDGDGFDTQAIGFLNDSVGWIGGRDSSYHGRDYKTTDGGTTWTRENWGKSLNRFRWVGHDIGYASGATIYRYCPGTSFSDTIALCPGQGYTIGGQTYYQAGDYTVNSNDVCSLQELLTLHTYPSQTPSITDSAGALHTGAYLHYQWQVDGSDLPGDTLPIIAPATNGTYTLMTIDSNHCADTSAGYVVSNVGIQRVPISQYTIYPDPAHDRIVISGMYDQTPITITDAIGRTVIKDIYQGHAKSIDISSLPDGVYFLNQNKFIKL